MFKYAKPTIPLGLLHDIEELEPGGSYDQANGGRGMRSGSFRRSCESWSPAV